MSDKLVRPLTLEEHRKVVEYFHNADNDLLFAMGADRAKLTAKEQWFAALREDFARELRQRCFCYLGWEYDGELVGHSNINAISFGECANIHLHIWGNGFRERGLGVWFIQRSVNYFMREFELQKIICEPYAENPAPNRVMEKLGFFPVKKYLTVPGAICFEQYVNRYEIVEAFVV